MDIHSVGLELLRGEGNSAKLMYAALQTSIVTASK